jgi:LacI family transcriptional regulator
VPLSDEMMPRLSTVRLPLQAMGRRAAELLTLEPAKRVSQPDVMLPVELLLRETT